MLTLILSAVTIIYFIGCLWFIISDTLNTEYNQFHRMSWVLKNGMDGYPLDYDRFITSAYFIITTLAVIGYGDLMPETNIEMIFAMCIMILGVAFFAFIMGRFVNIVTRFDEMNSEPDESTELHQWLKLLSRFSK